MKLSKSYWQTIKETPADAEVTSHKLLIRAGFINKTTSGIYSYLPMAVRVLGKIKKIIREELDAIGAQETLLSFVTPKSLWQESGRWETMGPEMLRIEDRKNGEFCLSATNEETVTDVFGKTVNSYKQLPVNLYQINTKFRDEIRPRFGLMRGREFMMKDGYSFHLDKESLDQTYDDYFNAYSRIFSRMGLEFIAVEADGGAMADAGSKTHEFQVIADNGEDVIVEVPEENYAVNLEKASGRRPKTSLVSEQGREEVLTEGKSTCEDVAALLGVEVCQTLKSIVYKVDEEFYLLMLLGDDELNDLKANNFLKGTGRFASDSELASLGLVKGYIGPQDSKIKVVFDSAINQDAYYIVGANKENYHLKGFNPKSVENAQSADLRMVKEGDLSPSGHKYTFRKGIEVGHIFQLGDKYTKSMNRTVLDSSGQKAHPLMGCYGIGVSRTLAAAIEQSHDENGIIWPVEIAPFDLYFATIAKSDEVKAACDEIYNELKSEGLDVLMDDRGLGFGAMLKDADLLGLPVRVLLGERDYKNEGTLEIKVRKTGEVHKVKKDELIPKVKALLSELKSNGN